MKLSANSSAVAKQNVQTMNQTIQKKSRCPPKARGAKIRSSIVRPAIDAPRVRDW